VCHPSERAALLVSNRGEYGWDIPGGAPKLFSERNFTR
jgi:hypothetical protein